MKTRHALALSLLLLAGPLLPGCGTAPAGAPGSPAEAAPAEMTPVPAAEEAPPAPVPTAEPTPEPAPEPTPEPLIMESQHVRLQHVLVGFKGTVPGRNVTRSQEQARALAAQILERARKGEDFGALVRKYTDDQAPGIYPLANRGTTPGPGEFSREGMIRAFGDVGFSLAVGEIGMAEYDPRTSPYGWHIIKRIE